ncbi:MAG: TetR/AcrR family transcriptional regulator [Lachnospiraceae bacterium]|nr:TetR/AcrR family transcriptional regulator [Lachnospiraceae bacterium]
MPPKIKVSKEKVLDTAFAMTREDGFEALTARKLAGRLQSSTQPIFRAYENMETLKEDLFYRSVDFFSDYMLKKQKEEPKEPAYLAMGMAYIELAKGERHLFELVASVEKREGDDIHEFLQKGDCAEMLNNLPDASDLTAAQKREVFGMVWMFTHGVATQVVSGRVELSDEKIRDLLKRAYKGFVTTSV